MEHIRGGRYLRSEQKRSARGHQLPETDMQLEEVASEESRGMTQLNPLAVGVAAQLVQTGVPCQPRLAPSSVPPPPSS